MKRFKISTLFEAIDGMTRPMRAINRALGRFRRQAAGIKAAWAGVARAGGSFVRSLRNIGVGAAAAGIGLFHMVKRAVGLGDSVAKTSEKLGLEVEVLQELRGAAQLAGIAQTALDMGTQRFIRRVAEAVGGTGEAKDVLKALGIQLTDTAGRIRATPDLLGDVADALLKIKDPATRVRIAFKLFDSEGVAMVNMLNKGSEGLAELRARFRATGAVMSKEFIANTARMNDEMTLTGAALRGVGLEVLGGFLPALIDATRELGSFIKANRTGLIDDMKGAVHSVAEAVKSFTAFLSPAVAGLKWFIEFIGGARVAGIALAALLGIKLAGSFLALLLSVGGMGKEVALLGAGFLKFAAGPVLAAIKAVALLGKAFFLTPFGLIVAGIALVAAGAFLLVKNWDKVSAFFSRMWGGIKRTFAIGALFVLEKIQSVTKALPDFIRARIGIDGLDKTIADLRAATQPGLAPGPATSTAAAAPPAGRIKGRVGLDIKVSREGAVRATLGRAVGDFAATLRSEVGPSLAGAGSGG